MFGLFGKKELSGGEVVRAVRDRLVKRFEGEACTLPKELLLVIADDSDHHRSRTGYMKYADGHLVRTGETRRFLALGETWGDYPARPFDCDLLSLRLDDGAGPEDVLRYYDGPFGAMTRRGMTPFSDSLLVGMASGELECPGRSAFAYASRAILSSQEIQAHAVQPVERDARYLAASDLRPVVSKPARFSSKIVDALAEKLAIILSA